MRAASVACLALFVALAAAQCSSIYTCLQETETDCNRPGFTCAAGTYCFVSTTGTVDPATGDYVGTCRAAARLGEACSRDPDTRKDCYDPDSFSVTCVDPNPSDNSLNGTCRYVSVAGLGEPCFTDTSYENGGCSAGVCVNGRCELETAPTSCITSSCNVDVYCAQGPIPRSCIARLAEGQGCNSTRQCDPRYICTSAGTQLPRTCRVPFTGKISDSCTNNLDCEAGLYCSDDNQCRKPSPYKKDYCSSSGDCQDGWDCECIYDLKGDQRIDLGSKCSLSEANTKEGINFYNKYQACARDNKCADFAYLGFSSSFIAVKDNFQIPAIAPDTCVYNCLKEAGVDFSNGKEGKCFSSAGALLPVLAIVVAALAVVLGY